MRPMGVMRMSYATLERQIRSLPESCLEEVSRYIDFVIYKQEKANSKEQNLSRYFGCLKSSLRDGLEMQRQMRDEWN